MKMNLEKGRKDRHIFHNKEIEIFTFPKKARSIITKKNQSRNTTYNHTHDKTLNFIYIYLGKLFTVLILLVLSRLILSKKTSGSFK